MLQKVIEYVREASNLMKYENIQVEKKGNESNYVTNIDVAVQKLLEKNLLTLLPESKVLGEEGDDTQNLEGYVWIIDPIDGTSNFIRDMGLSVISVALYQDQEPVLGVVYNPYRDEMFYAERGKGAFLNGEQIHVSKRDYKHSHLCSAMSLYDKNFADPCFRIIERVYRDSDDLRRLGAAALEMAYLAAGRVELYFEIRLFSWDIAAAMLLIQEAGGIVKLYGHEKLDGAGPYPVYAANSRESMDKLERIIFEEIPKAPY